MDGTIGIPHREIAIEFMRRQETGVRSQGYAISKLRIVTVHIAHLTRQEGTAIESAIKLIHAGRILILYINGMQTGCPLTGQILHHTIKIVRLSLSGKIIDSALFRRK